MDATNDRAARESRVAMEIVFVVPTYNRAEDLRQLLATLARMEVPAGLRWEVVIVDNNSADHTREAFRRTLRRCCRCATRLSAVRASRRPPAGRPRNLL